MKMEMRRFRKMFSVVDGASYEAERDLVRQKIMNDIRFSCGDRIISISEFKESRDPCRGYLFGSECFVNVKLSQEEENDESRIKYTWLGIDDDNSSKPVQEDK